MTTMFLAVLALSVIVGARDRVTLRVRPIRRKRPMPFRRIIGALAVLPILLPAIAGAHGTVALDDDPCVQRVGGNLVHFNAYQPQHAANAQYCTDIPGEGETFLVVDLVDPILRQLPVGVRVIKGLSEAGDDQTVASWPPTIHPDGVLRGEAKLAKGLYQLIITPEGFSSSSYLLRVQQVDYSASARKMIGPITIIFLFVLIGYELSKSRRVRSWRVSGHSS
jgi:hypothetical protein